MFAKRIFKKSAVLSALSVCLLSCSGNNNNNDVDYGTFTDSRDGQSYRVVEMPDGKMWMAQNLNFATNSGSWCYDDALDNCEKYGRLYDWTTAMDIDTLYNDSLWNGSDINHQGICPEGWRLPSNAEWEELVSNVGGLSIGGTKLKSSSEWESSEHAPLGIDEFNFSALPGGSRIPAGFPHMPDGGFDDIGVNANWWSATEYDTLYARGLSVHHSLEFVGLNWSGKTYGLSVRCVKD